jgi:hypothetical protein
MSKFSERLWRDLVREHGSDLRQLAPAAERHRRGARPPLLIGGGLAGLAGTGVAVAIALSAAATAPAFAVTRNTDGSYQVAIRALSAIPAANRKLARLGLEARVVGMSPGCTAPGVMRIGVPATASPLSKAQRAALPAALLETQHVPALLETQHVHLQSSLQVRIGRLARRLAKQAAAGVASTRAPGVLRAIRIVPAAIPIHRMLVIAASPAGRSIHLVRSGAIAGPVPTCLPPPACVKLKKAMPMIQVVGGPPAAGAAAAPCAKIAKARRHRAQARR